jgi:hypothetical protein
MRARPATCEDAHPLTGSPSMLKLQCGSNPIRFPKSSALFPFLKGVAEFAATAHSTAVRGDSLVPNDASPSRWGRLWRRNFRLGDVRGGDGAALLTLFAGFSSHGAAAVSAAPLRTARHPLSSSDAQ